MASKPRIALVGFRATGKSLIGFHLARHLDWSFVDMDDRLVVSLGASIDWWVGLHGWDAFRRQESRLLQELAGRNRIVVATGGGVVLDPMNRTWLRHGFHVVWLKARKETILSRIMADTRSPAYRPPLTALPLEEEIEAVLRERLPLYGATAAYSLQVDDLTPGEIVTDLLCWLRSVDDRNEQD